MKKMQCNCLHRPRHIQPKYTDFKANFRILICKRLLGEDPSRRDWISKFWSFSNTREIFSGIAPIAPEIRVFKKVNVR